MASTCTVMSRDDGSLRISLACTDTLSSLTKYIVSLKSMVSAIIKKV